MEDLHCVEAAIAGDDHALKILHDRYVNHIFHYAYMSARNYHDAEEITQDVFFKMARALHTYRGESSFKTWLFTISRNVVLDFYKKNEKRRAYTSNEEVDRITAKNSSIESEVIAKSEYEELLMCMNALTMDQQTVIHCRYIEGLSIKETAKVVNKTSISVKALQHRGRKALQKRMFEGGNVQ